VWTCCNILLHMPQPFEAEAFLNNIQEFGPYREENNSSPLERSIC
jgi:hypothetical protein